MKRLDKQPIDTPPGWEAYEGNVFELLGLIVLVMLCSMGLGSVFEWIIDKWAGGKK